jgi:iron complex outermembrane receptor protein
MHLLRYALIILVFSSGILSATAQAPSGSISGRLVDGKSKAVSYATVTLLRLDSSVVNGDLSKEDGSFSISPVAPGTFRLRVESIGFETKFVPVDVTAAAPDKKIGNLQLKATENTLNDVNIIGEKPVMELKVDKKVFNVEKNTTTAGGSAADVLQNVPSVSVDATGNVSLRGKSDVTVLIDGKPATMLGSDVASALQSLPASSIENVEVITNPSAKYDAQGTSGIINIITKKDGRFGINGNATLGAGTRDKYNGNLGLNIHKGKWNAFLNSSGRINRTFNNVTTDRQDKIAVDSTGRLQSYHTYEHVPRTFGGAFNTIGATYEPDKYNAITVTENINVMGFSYKDYSDYTAYGDQGETGAQLFNQHKYTNFAVDLFSLSSSVDYKHKFKKKDEELNIDATYAHTDIHRTQDYVTQNTPDTSHFNPIVEHSPATGGNSTFNAWADYTDPLFTKNGKLGLGFKSQFYNFESTNQPVISRGGGTPSIDYNLLSIYNYSQQIHAAYANWSDQLGKFSYQVGLRVEDAIYDGTGKLPSNGSSARDTTFHNSFFNLFPSAFVSYQLPNQQSIYLNYSRRTNRPGFMQLLPFVDLSNPGTVNVGNPALIPEFINNVEFSYNKIDNRGDNFILSAYYAKTDNLIEKITVPLDSVSAAKFGVPQSNLLATPVNIASGTTYGLEGIGHIQIIPAWDATLNLNFFQNELTIGNANPELAKYLSNNNGFTWFGKINTNIKLPKNFSVQINGNYESPKVIAQGNLKETYWVDVAVRKNLWKNKATLILNCSDIFKTHILVTNYNLPAYSETIDRVRETRIGNITFTYRFGKSDAGKNFATGSGGKRGKDTKPKVEKPSDDDRTKNLKEGDDNDQGGGGMQGGGGQKK